MNTITEAKRAKEQIGYLYSNTKKAVEKLKEEKHKQSYKLQDAIRALEQKRYQSESEFEAKIKEVEEANKKAVEPYRTITDKHERILSLIGISKNGKEDLTLKANNRGKEIICIHEEVIGGAIGRDYLHIYVYVYRNNKPTNRFSLALAAKSIFTSEMCGYRWGSIEPYFEGGGQIFFEFNVKDAPTKEELIEYYNKKGLSNLWKSAEFAELVKEYETVLTECNTPEWEREYLLSQKEYYEECVSNGISSPEYKKIVRLLKAA